MESGDHEEIAVGRPGDGPGSNAERARRLALLQQAAEAAAQGDPTVMLAALYESQLMTALAGRLRRQFPRLGKEEADVAVGQAVDSFYRKLQSGGRVEHPVAYLLTTARRKVLRHCDRWDREQPLDEDRAAAGGPEPADDDEKLLEDALAVAKSLIPRLGEENVQRVVGYWLDAIERGAMYTHAETAEALGLNPASVRKWLERGLRRMENRARELDLDRELERLRMGERAREHGPTEEA